MAKDETGTSREERLAAKLRENLKRRKAQARALSDCKADGNSSSQSAAEKLGRAASD